MRNGVLEMVIHQLGGWSNTDMLLGYIHKKMSKNVRQCRVWREWSDWDEVIVFAQYMGKTPIY